MLDTKKVVFSGVQPSGNLTIGNYLGALRNFDTFSDEYKCFYCVADMHAITVRQVPADLRRHTYETLALYMACGLDPQKNTLYVQSHVPAHAELAWVLNCYTMFGELSRMTQFKDKSAKNADNINAGLFTYPVLMAADILLYQSHLVPVGADQKQHLEIARDIAERFNKTYGPAFVIPDPYIPKAGARVMSLQDPAQKMSKSDPNPNGFVSIIDTPDVIRKKLRKAVTDCDGIVKYDIANKAGVSNLLAIYTSFTGKTMQEAEEHFAGQNYGALKNETADAIIEGLAPIQTEYARLMGNKDYLHEIMHDGALRAGEAAAKTVKKVYAAMGFNA